MKHTSISKIILILILLQGISFAQKDPMNSPMWEYVKNKFLKDKKFVFDDKNIIIKVPSFADNPTQVPIYIDASHFKNAKRLFVFADLNAIIPVLDMELLNFNAVISFNMKIAQGTPLRVAVEDKNGLMHIGSAQIESFGGGCAVASTSSGLVNWESQLGKSKNAVFKINDTERIKLSIFHPMETGLFEGNPEFFINKLSIKDNSKVIMNMKIYSSVSENPRFMFETNYNNENYDIVANDSDGNEFNIKIKYKNKGKL